AACGSGGALPLPLIGQDGDGAVVLVADDAAVAVLEGNLAALEVEGIAIAVAGRLAHDADVAVVVEPAELHVVGDVAPDEVLADAAPGRPFRPEHAGVQTLDGRVADLVLAEGRVEADEVRVGVADGFLAAPVAVVGRRRGGQRPPGRGRGGGSEQGPPVDREESMVFARCVHRVGSFRLGVWATFYGNNAAKRGSCSNTAGK